MNKSLSNGYIKPKFGLFSYISSLPPSQGVEDEKNIKKTKKLKKIKKNKKLNATHSDLFSNTSFITVGCKYNKKPFDLTLKETNPRLNLEIHHKVFKPPGPVDSLFAPCPYISSPKNTEKNIKHKTEPKNFLLPKRNNFFSTYDSNYLPDVSEVNTKFTKSDINKIKKKGKKEKGFLTAVHSIECFNPDSSVYGNSVVAGGRSNSKDISQKDNESSQSQSNKEKSSFYESNDSLLLKLKEKKFKPLGRSRSEMFSFYEYKGETEFPAKKRKLLPPLCQKPFKPPTSLFTVASPPVITNPVYLKREYHLK